MLLVNVIDLWSSFIVQSLFVMGYWSLEKKGMQLMNAYARFVVAKLILKIMLGYLAKNLKHHNSVTINNFLPKLQLTCARQTVRLIYQFGQELSNEIDFNQKSVTMAKLQRAVLLFQVVQTLETTTIPTLCTQW
jgi:hypothetical protein